MCNIKYVSSLSTMLFSLCIIYICLQITEWTHFITTITDNIMQNKGIVASELQKKKNTK